MNEQDAFIIVPVSLGDTARKPSDIDVEASYLLKQFDKLLREKLGLKIDIIQLHGFDYDKCKQLIKSEGITALMSMMYLQEDIMGRFTDVGHKYLIVDMLRDKLKGLSPSYEIIIVDRYIFPSFHNTEDRKDYLTLFTDIFSPTISNIKHINFITCPKYNTDLFSDFKKSLIRLNPELSVVCKTTKEFHDRFWIIDRTKGLFIGTSLNGIGKRYALVDIIRDKDTEDLLNILMKLKLVD